MQYFDIPDHKGHDWEKMFRRAFLVGLAGLAVLITVLALTAPPAPPPPSPDPAQRSASSGAAEPAPVEQRITTTDGRSVVCLVFPSRQVSCDWASSHRT